MIPVTVKVNPFSTLTYLSYQLERAGNVVISIFDVQGNHVNTLVDYVQEKCYYQPNWTGLDERGQQMSHGAYFFRMWVGGLKSSGKICLLK